MDWIKEKYPHYLTREFENTIPNFDSHKQARSWFEEKYGKDFIQVGVEEIDGERIYFYDLVTNRKDYDEYQNFLNGRTVLQITPENEDITERGMFASNRVEITENGNVHIVF